MISPNGAKLFGRYQEVVLLLLGSLLTTGVGSFLTSEFQSRSALQQRALELRESERSSATAVFDEISRLMDRRLYRMRRIMTGWAEQKPTGEMDARWNDYRVVLFEWNDSLNRNLAMLERYFGLDARIVFETRVHGGLRELGQQLEKTLASPPHEPRLAEMERLADRVNNDIYLLDLALISAIQSGRVGALLDPLEK